MLSPACTRAVLIAFNIVYAMVGPALVLLGVCTTLSSTNPRLLHLMTSERATQDIIFWASHLLYFSGAVTFSLALLGCCCPVTTKQSAICWYLFVVSTLGCVELLAVLLTLYTRNSLLPALGTRLINSIVNDYGHQDNNNLNTHGDNVFTQALDYTQFVYNCCGVTGGDEYQLSRWFNNSLQTKEPRNVPLTCCYTTDLKCSSGSPISVVSRVFHGTVEEAWQSPMVHNEQDCQNNKPGARYSEGCLGHIEDWFFYQTGGLILVLGSLIVLKVVCVTFLISVLRKIRH